MSDKLKMAKRRAYRTITVNDHPLFPGRTQVDEHRLVMAEYLGRNLARDEIVHHKDQNTRNNDLTNLELIKLGDHSRLHNTGREQSVETRAKRSKKLQGRIRTKEHSQKIRDSLLAKRMHRTDAEKQNLSMKQKGRLKSESTKQKMRESWTEERRQVRREWAQQQQRKNGFFV